MIREMLYDGRNYKPVLITIQVISGDPTLFYINNSTTGIANNALQVVDRLTNTTGRKEYRLSPTDTIVPIIGFTNRSAIYLESVTLNHLLTTSNSGFSGAKVCQVFDVPNNFFSVTASGYFTRSFKPRTVIFPSSFFGTAVIGGNINHNFNRSGIWKLGNINLSAQTSFQSTFLDSDIEEIGNINLPNCTSLTACFQNTNDLRKIGTITVNSGLLTINNVFNGSGVDEVVFINSMASVTNANTAFTGMGNLRRLVLPGFRLGFDISNNRMQATALNETFTSLGNASGSQTINVANNPGTETCNTSIATGKGYTVITV